MAWTSLAHGCKQATISILMVELDVLQGKAMWLTLLLGRTGSDSSLS